MTSSRYKIRSTSFFYILVNQVLKLKVGMYLTWGRGKGEEIFFFFFFFTG